MEVVRELPLDQVLLGDCVQLMRMLPPASVHCVFADPPYNLQLRGELRRPVEQTYPRLLLLGMVMTVAYVALIETLGFFLCTFLYLAGFMLIGRYRRIGVVAVTSLIGSLVFMFVFMKIVYVSLPLGQEPFVRVSLMLMRLMGIR